ncbi:MAG TPA: FAD:protein FMN transferase [Acidimicrobiales bacterium]|nr:FAD:protein FMN transferase [Acidimicrobiales bacterium]
MIVHAEPVMGTVVSFHLEPGGCPARDARAAVAASCARLHELDALFSTWNPESPMSRFRAGHLRLADAPPEISVVLELCEEANVLSQGWFDPWAMPGGFDPTGLVKGWATAQALAVLQTAGVESVVVNGGGDIAVLGHPCGSGAWRIGIRHPWRSEALACVLEVDRPVATSGCYERGPHLINPRDGTLLSRTASATVVGSSLALCDALATALVVAGDDGPELARSLRGYEAYLIGVDGEEDATGGIVFASEGVA